MKRYSRVLVLLVFAALIVGMMPGVAVADSYRSAGRTADASYYEDLPNGDYRYVGVYGGLQKWNEKVKGSKPARFSDVGFMVYMDEFSINDPADPSDDHYRSVNLWVRPYDIGIDRTLTYAHISGTYEAEVWEWTGEWPDEWTGEWPETTTTTVELDLTWTGYGALNRWRSSGSSTWDGMRWMSRDNYTYRDATVAGFVHEVGGWHVDGADMWASLSEYKSGATWTSGFWQ